MRINTSNLKKITPPEKGYDLEFDDDLTGFGVRIMHSGKISFIAQGRIDGVGKERRVTLGKWGVITPEEARKKAKRKLADMSNGIDPVAEKRLEKALSVTLSEVGDSYLENRRTKGGKPLKERTKKDIRYHLKSTFPDWSDKSVAGGITREMIQRRYAERCKGSVAQANQAMRVLHGLYEYAAASYRTPDGARIIADNPVDVLRESSMLRSVEPCKNHVPLDDLGKWWSSLQAMRADPALTTASRSAADLVAVLALTGLRLGEGRSLRWDQVDLEEGSLRLTDTKNRTNLTLPLSKGAIGILEDRRGRGAYVFPARSGKGHLKDCRGQLQLLADETEVTVTAHDLRRTFSAVAAKVDVELWRTKALMGHKQSTDVTLHHYKDLSDVRFLKPEADRIGEYFEECSRVFEADNVVKLERRA
jgi:integrase